MNMNTVNRSKERRGFLLSYTKYPPNILLYIHSFIFNHQLIVSHSLKKEQNINSNKKKNQLKNEKRAFLSKNSRDTQCIQLNYAVLTSQNSAVWINLRYYICFISHEITREQAHLAIKLFVWLIVSPIKCGTVSKSCCYDQFV